MARAFVACITCWKLKALRAQLRFEDRPGRHMLYCRGGVRARAIDAASRAGEHPGQRLAPSFCFSHHWTCSIAVAGAGLPPGRAVGDGEDTRLVRVMSGDGRRRA